MAWSVFMTYVIQGIIVFALLAVAIMIVLGIVKAVREDK